MRRRSSNSPLACGTLSRQDRAKSDALQRWCRQESSRHASRDRRLGPIESFSPVPISFRSKRITNVSLCRSCGEHGLEPNINTSGKAMLDRTRHRHWSK
ncbi:hypothetical protein NXT3_PA00115 (plasmid) [Sinorhizobium fredii]|uniref:Uncharacterized protein n=1 Tax=Rhizobium fredii TaxID=380 RepID=A0A2L0HCA8_RHIFR|nr:hypothetical protein NXT3_PA00115 [Sinorhizobium fredii]